LPNYVADFAVNLAEAMAVRQPQMWRDECVAGGFIQPLRLTSLQTLQTKIAVNDTHLKELGEIGL